MALMLSSRATNAATGQSRTAPANGSRVLVSWLRRALTALRWFRNRVGGLLRQLRAPGVRKTDSWSVWYNALYRSLGDRALQSAPPGHHMHELILHDIKGNPQQLSLRCDKQP